MRTQKLAAIVFMTVAGFFTSVNALDSQEVQLISKGGPAQPYHSKAMREKCHGLSKDMYEFGALLNESNQKIFCAKFTDEQRKKAMQMSSEKNIFGNPKMTPDQAVEKVGKEIGNNPDKKE